MSPGITGIQLIGDDARAAGKDFEVLYKLSRLAYVDRVGESRSAHPVAQREWRCRRESNGARPTRRPRSLPEEFAEE